MRARDSVGSLPAPRCVRSSGRSARSRPSSKRAAAAPSGGCWSSSSPAPPDHVADLFGTDMTLRVKRLNLADGEPFAIVTVWCPAELGAALSRARRRGPPVLRTDRCRAAGRQPDDRRGLGRPRRRRAAGRPGRLTAAAVRAGHHRHLRSPGPRQLARVPGRSHRVRRRPALGARRRPPRAVSASWSSRRHHADCGDGARPGDPQWLRRRRGRRAGPRCRRRRRPTV